MPYSKKTRRLTNWPNIATKFATRGTLRSLLLSNWPSWRPAASATQWMEFESNAQSSTPPGESCARLPAGLRPHRHLWCDAQSTWSDQKGTVGIKGRQSVSAPLASDFCKSDHLQLSISHFWPFNVAKCCQRNSRHNGLNIPLGTTALGGIPPIYGIKQGLWGTYPWELYRIKNSYDTNTIESKTKIPIYTS